jgi:DNA-binding PucR family transcriptional regulator
MTREKSLDGSLHDRTLGPAEARAYLDAPITDSERGDVLALVHWFQRRYPTPAERLSYVRRAYARWQRSQRPAAAKPPVEVLRGPAHR